MADDADLVFHPLHKLEVIVRGEQERFVRRLFDESGVTGYTLIRDVAGMGHHGYQEGRLLFNDQASLVVMMTVAAEDAIRRIAAGLKPLFEKHSGVMFVSEAKVVRLQHFMKQETAAE